MTRAVVLTLTLPD